MRETDAIGFASSLGALLVAAVLCVVAQVAGLFVPAGFYLDLLRAFCVGGYLGLFGLLTAWAVFGPYHWLARQFLTLLVIAGLAGSYLTVVVLAAENALEVDALTHAAGAVPFGLLTAQAPLWLWRTARAWRGAGTNSGVTPAPERFCLGICWPVLQS